MDGMEFSQYAQMRNSSFCFAMVTSRNFDLFYILTLKYGVFNSNVEIWRKY